MIQGHPTLHRNYTSLTDAIVGWCDAVARIRRLLERAEGGKLEVFLPKIAEADPGRRNLQCRAALAATFVAGLELARDGALTMDQDAPWQPIQVHRRSGKPSGSAAGPTIDEHAPSLA